MEDKTGNNPQPAFERDECVWSAPGSGRQRYVQRRHPVDTSANIHIINIEADVHGRLVDISLDGCKVRTDRRFPLGIFRRVEVEFQIDGLPFRLGGVTQAIYDPYDIGIRFLDLSDRKRTQLLQLIEEIRKAEKHCENSGS